MVQYHRQRLYKSSYDSISSLPLTINHNHYSLFPLPPQAITTPINMSVPAKMFRTFRASPWCTLDAAPLAVLITGFLSGATFVAWRAAHGPDVVWNRHGNPTPWMSVKDNEGVKLYQVNVRWRSTLFPVFSSDFMI